MAQAYEVKKFQESGGKEGLDPKELSPRYRDKIVELAKGIKKSDLKHFAETKRSGLPDHVDENNPVATVSNVNGMGATVFPTATSNGSGDLPASGNRLKRFSEWKKRKRRPKQD
jgi:hypothetical protein